MGKVVVLRTRATRDRARSINLHAMHRVHLRSALQAMIADCEELELFDESCFYAKILAEVLKHHRVRS